MSAMASNITTVLLFVLMRGFNLTSHKSALINLFITILQILFIAPPLHLFPQPLAPSQHCQVGGLERC